MANKSELFDLVELLWAHGMRSPTLLAEALGISKEYARYCLRELGHTQPRKRLPEFLCRLSESEKVRIAEFRNAFVMKRQPKCLKIA